MSTNITTPNTVPVGDALLGRMIDTAGAPLDDGGAIDAAGQLPIDRPVGSDMGRLPDQLLETGIKVIDLFAPIARGGTYTMTAVPGVGKIVVTFELIQRMAARRAGRAVIACLDEPPYSMKELFA